MVQCKYTPALICPKECDGVNCVRGHAPNQIKPDIHETLDERGKRYGDFTQHADIADELLNSIMSRGRQRNTDNWENMHPFQRQALRTICDKLARIANGDPHYGDNWRDIAGYATLVLDRLAPATNALRELSK